jgi:hypothetical protein
MIKAAIIAEKISLTANAGYEFFLQCCLPLSPYKTTKKHFIV